jgi:diadenosine tetraphosphate (Ap4A) HIT family hydrolase
MNVHQANCVFCTLPDNRARAIIENSLAWAFPTNIPIVWGHTLVVPQRCVAAWDELRKEEHDAIEIMVWRVKQALRKNFRAEGFHINYNEGAVAGQSVPHFHLHIIPRYAGDTGILKFEPREFIYRPGSRAPTPEAELIEVARQIRLAVP